MLSRFGAARKLAAIRKRLPEALLVMSTSVRAGLSLPQAIKAASDQVPDPLGAELRRVGEDVSLGTSVDASLDSFHARVRLPEIRLLVAGLKLARTTGASLGPLLDKLGEAMREREKLRGQMKTLTAQGRLSGAVVGAMPVALVALMAAIDPEFVRPLVATPVGWLLLGIAAVLEALGLLAIRAIVRQEP